MHEFLVLHFFATDSANSWYSFLVEHLPEGAWPMADERRHTALAMFQTCHVAPSYRRLPHPTWTDCISLILDLILGAGKLRYLSTHPSAKKHRDVFVRGFSAGSYSGLYVFFTYFGSSRTLMQVASLEGLHVPQSCCV